MVDILDMDILRLEINDFLDIVRLVLWEDTHKEARESLEILCSVYLFPNNFNSEIINHFNNIESIILRLNNIYELEMFIYSVYCDARELVKFLAAIKKEIQ